MKILIIDDHTLFADALAMALEGQGFSVSNASNGAQAFEITANGEFDLILLDMVLPDIHGEVLLKSFKQNKPSLKIIVVSSLNVDVTRISSLGADGFINKAESISSMMQAINAVLGGEPYFDGHADAADLSVKYSLSPRQLAVAESMMQSLSNKQIAHNLNISEGTVKQQINRIFKTLDVKNRANCIRKLEQLGLVSST